MDGEGFKVTGKNGLVVTLKARPLTATIELFGEIEQKKLIITNNIGDINMKLTKAQIKKIIKEELEQVMKELEADTLEEDEDAAAEKELMDALAQPMHK